MRKITGNRGCCGAVLNSTDSAARTVTRTGLKSHSTFELSYFCDPSSWRCKPQLHLHFGAPSSSFSKSVLKAQSFQLISFTTICVSQTVMFLKLTCLHSVATAGTKLVTKILVYANYKSFFVNYFENKESKTLYARMENMHDLAYAIVASEQIEGASCEQT